MDGGRVKALSMVFGFLSLFIMLPIWLYLMHFVLVAVHAGDLPMFLFYLYVPLSLFLAAVKVIIDGVNK
jgi:hypothetical protein